VQLLCGTAFMLSVFGISIVFLGFAATRILLLPLLFCITMIPFADYVLDILTLRYQFVSTTLAARAFTLLGFSIQQAGNTIMSSDLPEPLQVGIPCSGLKLFVTLITCCWFLSYIIEAPKYKKAIIMALSLPLSIVCNTLRIIFIGLVGFYTFSSSSMEAFHDWSGGISILICVATLYGTMRLLGMRNIRGFDEMEPASGTASCAGGRLAGLLTASALVLLTVAAVSGWAAASALSIPRGHLDRARIPNSFDVWDGTDLVIDNKTKDLLSQGDLMSRAYIDTSGNGRLVHVFLTAARETRAFHDPLMCLPAAGNVCLQDRLVKLQLGGGRQGSVQARLLRVSQEGSTYLIAYWYAAGDTSWSDTSKMQVYMKRMALADAVHILLNPFGINRIRQKIASRQFVFLRFAMKESGGKDDMAYFERFISDFAGHTGRLTR